MMRGSPAVVVIRPKVFALKFRLGLPQLKLLNRLNASQREIRARALGLREQPSCVRRERAAPGGVMFYDADYVPQTGTTVPHRPWALGLLPSEIQKVGHHIVCVYEKP